MPRRPVRPVAAVLVAAAILLGVAVPPAVAAESDPGAVSYRPPVAGPIVDRFDPPAQPWQAGNRGIDYGVGAGTEVVAAADGEVVFAGPVAGALHVTVRHADGLRTSYSFLAAIAVHVGQRVRMGQPVGVAGGPVHVGVRTPDGTYLDPEALFAGALEPRVRLVPGAEDGLDPLAERRSLLDTLLDRGAAAVAHLQGAASDWLEVAAHYATELDPVTHGLRAADAVREWVDQLDGCTAAATPVPPHEQRRIAVVVSGLGTGSAGNSAWEIDTATLGYPPADVVRFSYSGGQAPRMVDGGAAEAAGGSDGLAGIPVHEFSAADSQQHLEVSADRLEELLRLVATAEPGVPIDVIAHSQGGVVARLGVVEAGEDGTLPPTVENLVTVGTPHQGAPLATGVLAVQKTESGRTALGALRSSGLAAGLDDRLPAITELAETSPVLERMRGLDIPAGVRFTSIGGATDLVVPGTATADPKADSHRLIQTGVNRDAHGDLASMPATTREIGLAIAGEGPTCQSLGDAVTVFVTAEAVRAGETGLSLLATGEAVQADGVRLAGRTTGVTED